MNIIAHNSNLAINFANLNIVITNTLFTPLRNRPKQNEAKLSEIEKTEAPSLSQNILKTPGSNPNRRCSYFWPIVKTGLVSGAAFAAIVVVDELNRQRFFSGR